MARQFNLIPPVCEQAEYHLFQREKVEVQLPELYHKIGMCQSINHNVYSLNTEQNISKSQLFILVMNITLIL